MSSRALPLVQVNGWCQGPFLRAALQYVLRHTEAVRPAIGLSLWERVFTV
jgi:hypothetical protein